MREVRKLRKLLFVFAVTALLAVAAASAWASVTNPQAVGLHGLKAEYRGGKTHLVWVAQVGRTVGPRGKVLVWRRADGVKDCIAKLDVPDPKQGENTVAMKYTDKNPPQGTTVKYIVEGFGTAGTPSIWVTVDTSKKEDSKVTSPGTGEIDEGASGSEFEGRLRKYEEQADWPERLAGSIVMAIPNYIMKAIGLYDPAELIFQVQLQKRGFDQADMPSPADAKILHTFTEEEFGAVAAFYDTLNGYAPVWLVVVLILLALGLFWSAANPESRLTWRHYAVGFLLGVLLLRFGVELLSFVFDANWALVKGFQSVVDDKLGESLLACFYNEEAKSLGNAIIACVAVLSVGVINWQYIMRKLSIALLLGVLPLVAVVSIPPSNRGALGVWFKELISNIFLQSAHAAAFVLLILLIHATPAGAAAFWMKLAALVGLMSMASLVRRVVGAESFGGIASGIGAAFGLGTFFAMTRMLGEKGGGAPGGAPRGDGGVPAGGYSLPGRALRMAAAVGLGAAGATAGTMASGAAGLGPEEGIVAGSIAGAAAGRLAVDTGVSAASFAADTRKRGLRETVGDLYDPQTASAAGTRIFGDNIIGRAAGTAMAGGSWIAGKVRPEKAAGAKAIRADYVSAQESLDAARAKLQGMRPDLDAARAEHDYAKNMFGPHSANLREMNVRLQEIDFQRAQAEQDLVEAAQSVEEAPVWRRREAVERMAESYQGYNQANYDYNSLQSEITAGEQRYRDSVKNLQAAEAEHARQRLEIASLEKKLQFDPAFKQFEKLRQPRAPGGLETRWK